MRAASPAGMSACLPMWAPTARNAASKPPSRHCFLDVGDLPVQLELDAHRQDPVDLGIEHVARQPVGRDAEAHHAAGHRPGFEDRHLVAEAAQVVGGGEAGGPGADDQNALAGGLGGRVEGPALLDRLVADEALDRVDADRLVELPAVAGGLAGVVTDATHDRRERVVLDDLVPGALVALAAVLGLIQPGLAVLTGGAGVVTGGQPVDVLGALGPPAAGLVGEAGADVERNGVGMPDGHHCGPCGVSASRSVRPSWSRSGSDP